MQVILSETEWNEFECLRASRDSTVTIATITEIRRDCINDMIRALRDGNLKMQPCLYYEDAISILERIRDAHAKTIDAEKRSIPRH